jgi:hypothetical protein
MTKIKEIRCEFGRISVAIDRQTKYLQDGIVFVDPKFILLGKNGNYKVSWKKVTSLVTKDTGFYLESKKHTVEAVSPQGPAWQNCKKLLEKYWQKKQEVQQRKSLEQQQEEDEEQRRKRATRRPVYGKTYSKRPLKFLSKNEGANNWDSEDDEDTFNIARPKRKPLDEDDEQEVVTPNLQEEDEEEDNDDGEAVFEDTAEKDEHDEEEDEEQLPQPQKKLFKKKRIHLEDDSDDENLFGDAEMTTPNAAKRIVSPATDGMNRLYDDDEDETAEGISITVQQESPPKSRKVTPAISSFFTKPKAAKSKPTTASLTGKVNPQDEVEGEEETVKTDLAPVKKTPPPRNFFARKKKTPSPSEETVSTVMEASQASTVIPSPAYMDEEDEEVLQDKALKTPPRKPYSFGYTSSIKTLEEEDPLLDDSPGDSRPASSLSKPRPFRRDILGRKTYGSSGRKRDTAAMALEFADAHQSPTHRPVSLNMSPNRHKRLKKSPLAGLTYKSPAKSPMANNQPPAPIPDFRGIKNIGNTCYMNSSLQMLFSIPSFVQQLASKRQGRRIVSSLWNLFQQLQERKTGSASARDLKAAVDEQTEKFRGYQQRDANEFLGDLLDTIHVALEGTVDDMGGEEEEKKEEHRDDKNETKSNKELLPTDDFFRLNVEVCLRCKSCGYSRYVARDLILLLVFVRYMTLVKLTT